MILCREQNLAVSRLHFINKIYNGVFPHYFYSIIPPAAYVIRVKKKNPNGVVPGTDCITQRHTWIFPEILYQLYYIRDSRFFVLILLLGLQAKYGLRIRGHCQFFQQNRKAFQTVEENQAVGIVSAGRK